MIGGRFVCNQSVPPTVMKALIQLENRGFAPRTPETDANGLAGKDSDLGNLKWSRSAVKSSLMTLDLDASGCITYHPHLQPRTTGFHRGRSDGCNPPLENSFAPGICDSGSSGTVDSRFRPAADSAGESGGGFGGIHGGRFTGRGGGDGGDNEGGGLGGTGMNPTESYYQKALQANPGHPLLLGNYARFLFEVQRNLPKAEEYYQRAILASPTDGEVLAQFAKLLWEAHRDQQRAGLYFDQALQATPENCYVLAAYASFLWSSDGAEESVEAQGLETSNV